MDPVYRLSISPGHRSVVVDGGQDVVLVERDSKVTPAALGAYFDLR